MTRKFIYEATLNVRSYERGIRSIEHGATRAISAANRMRLAFRHFSRGNIGRGFDEVGVAVVGFGKKLFQVGEIGVSAGGKIVAAFGGVLRIMRRISMIGGVVTGVLAGLGAKTVSKAAEFESEVARAAIQAGANPAEHRELFKKARDVGIETPYSLMDIASTEKEFGQRGFDAQQILALIDATKILAVLGDTDMRTAGEVLAQVMNQFGLPMERATETALKLASATVNTALSGEELFDALKDAGSAAGVFNLNLTETLAVVGELRKSLGGAEKSSVAVRNLLLVASAIHGKNPKQLEALGFSEDEATSFSFMRDGGEVKSIVDVMHRLAREFESNPEMAMKAGFEKRTILAFKKIADTEKQVFTDLMSRIDDTARTQQQYNEIIELSDNKLKRLSSTGEAVFIAIGLKLREAFSIDSQVDKLNEALAQIESTVMNMSAEDVREIVSTLGSGVVRAFSVGVQFLLESFVAVAPTIAKIMFEAIKGVASGFLDSDDLKQTKARFAAMSPAERAAEDAFLAGRVGFKSLSDAPSDPFFMDMVRSAHGSGIARRIEALRQIEADRNAVDPFIGFAMHGIGSAADNAMTRLRTNPTYLAVEQAAEAARDRATTENIQKMIEDSIIRSPLMDLSNRGTMNIYGVGSGSQRAKPSRGVGSTAPKTAQR